LVLRERNPHSDREDFSNQLQRIHRLRGLDEGGDNGGGAAARVTRGDRVGPQVLGISFFCAMIEERVQTIRSYDRPVRAWGSE
jgi:hypothetical protein